MTAQLDLTGLAATSRQLDAAETLADALRASRDRQVIQLASERAPLADLAAATGKSVQAMSKITRAAGLRRYRERAADLSAAIDAGALG